MSSWWNSHLPWRGLTLLVALLLLLVACQTGAPAAEESGPSSSPVPTLPATSSPTPAPAAVLLGEYRLLSPAQMRADLDEFFVRLEQIHPDPYAWRSRPEVERERRQLADGLTAPLTMVDFYRRMAPLVQSLGDRHTVLVLPAEVLDELMRSERFLPLGVQVQADHAYIILNASGSTGIALGDELLSVNGMPMSEVAARAAVYIPGSMLHPLVFPLIFGSPSEYELGLRSPGDSSVRQAVVPALTAAALQRVPPTSLPPGGQAAGDVVYTQIGAEKIGLLTLNGFVGIGPQLAPIFAELESQAITDLVIDVRANRGGGLDEIAGLMDYLVEQPYQKCARSYKAPFAGYGAGPRELACEPIQPFPVSQPFRGSIALLIGPETFSAGIMFATILQDLARATLFGEETADLASFCADTPQPAALSHSGLGYNIARTCFVRPSGVRDERGVIPDQVVVTTISDLLAGNDPVLAAALAWIQAGHPMP